MARNVHPARVARPKAPRKVSVRKITAAHITKAKRGSTVRSVGVRKATSRTTPR